jgi:protein TonB
MIQFLDTLGMAGLAVFFIVALVGTIYLMRYIMGKKSAELTANSTNVAHLQKKHAEVDIHKYRKLITNVGLMLSLAVVLAAFEFPDFEESELIDLGSLNADMEEMMEIPPTEQLPPPPPKIETPQIVEVPDEEEIEEEIEIDLDMEADEETVIEEIIIDEEPVEEEKVDEIFEIVEESAEPLGGYAAFYKYVNKNIKYPNQAKRMGVEGKVYVQFVVDQNGNITDVKAIRGIGAGCDEEAIRVLRESPKWKPGKQRGRAVKQRIVLPINFKLG